MARPRAIQQSDFPYHICARCINREWFTLPMEQVWELFCEELYVVNKIENLQVHCFVLMSNHFHLIASTPDANISRCMMRFMKNSSIRLAEAGNRINETFAGRHFKSILSKEHIFLNTYKYVYQNPIRAKIVSRAEEYKFSTLHGLTGQSRLLVPMVPDHMLVESTEETLSWINKKPNEEKIEAVKSGLRRSIYASPKNKCSGKPIIASGELI